MSGRVVGVLFGGYFCRRGKERGEFSYLNFICRIDWSLIVEYCGVRSGSEVRVVFRWIFDRGDDMVRSSFLGSVRFFRF